MKKLLSGIICAAFAVAAFTSCGNKGAANNGAAEAEVKETAKIETVEAKDGELVIVAHVTVKPEFKDVVTEAFKKVVEGTRTEPGCVSYVLHQDVNDPLKFTFVEVWKSQEAIDIHGNTPHFKEFVQAIDGKADLEVYTMKRLF